MKRTFIIFLCLSIHIFATIDAIAQNLDSISLDTVKNLSNANFIVNDTLKPLGDSLLTDSIPLIDSILPNDTLNLDTIIQNKNAIPSPIDFSSEDSMYISVVNKEIILFGNGKLVTEGMELGADSIGIDMETKELEAHGMYDSLNNLQGMPAFKDGDKEYNSDFMKYNFDTKKGIIYDVMTQEQEGYLHGKIVKIHSKDEMHIKGGKYTTCNHPNPHYYIDLSKAKLKSKDKIITGPFHFVIQGIPIPIGAPFGFFPLSRTNTSGIHFPTYRDEIDLGFGLVGMGYYWAINDYVDLDATIDLYSKGSWGVHLLSRFKKRYKFTGNANINYFHKRTGPKELVTTQIGNTYSIQLSYQQDRKARPNSSLSASINYVYGDYRQFNSNNINDFVNTTTTSSVAYQKSFAGTPFRMTATMNMTGNLSDSTINLRFPTVNFNMSKQTIGSLFMKNKPKKGTWYEELGISFTTSLSNSIYTHDTILTNFDHIDSTFRAMKSGFKYNVPIQTSFRVFKYLNVTPSLNYSGKIYPNRIERKLKVTDYGNSIENDTIWGFNHVGEFRTNLNFNTRLYGMLNLNWGRLKKIRHVISPSMSLGYKPDFSEDGILWGDYYDQDPLDSTRIYSYYENFLFGTASKDEQKLISFSLGNNFEAKMLSKDTTQTYKKVKLIDNLSFSQSYNFAKDSLRLSYLTVSASMRPIQNTSISFSSSFDPYVLNEEGVNINKLELTENKKIGRLTNANLTLNTSFSAKDFNKKKEKKSLIDWRASVSYSFRYSKFFNVQKQEFDIKITQNATVNFNIAPTPQWKVDVRTGYDFNKSKITSTTFQLHRELHCWEMSLQVTPFGRMKSYMFRINVKSSMFDALQLKRERSWHDNF